GRLETRKRPPRVYPRNIAARRNPPRVFAAKVDPAGNRANATMRELTSKLDPEAGAGVQCSGGDDTAMLTQGARALSGTRCIVLLLHGKDVIAWLLRVRRSDPARALTRLAQWL